MDRVSSFWTCFLDSPYTNNEQTNSRTKTTSCQLTDHFKAYKMQVMQELKPRDFNARFDVGFSDKTLKMNQISYAPSCSLTRPHLQQITSSTERIFDI